MSLCECLPSRLKLALEEDNTVWEAFTSIYSAEDEEERFYSLREWEEGSR